MAQPHDHANLGTDKLLIAWALVGPWWGTFKEVRCICLDEFLVNLGNALFRKSSSPFYALGTGPNAENLFFWKKTENKQWSTWSFRYIHAMEEGKASKNPMKVILSRAGRKTPVIRTTKARLLGKCKSQPYRPCRKSILNRDSCGYYPQHNPQQLLSPGICAPGVSEAGSSKASQRRGRRLSLQCAYWESRKPCLWIPGTKP